MTGAVARTRRWTPMPTKVALALERAWTGWRPSRQSHGNIRQRFDFAFPVQQHWGARVAFYLYLGGTGAGFAFLEVLLRWFGVLGERTAVVGMWLGIALEVLSVVAIFDHLGPVARWSFWFAVRRPGRSWISRGGILLTTLIVLRLLVALPTLSVTSGLPWAEGSVLGDALLVLVLAFALGFMLYSGLVISSWNAIAFWNSPLVPVLFVGFSFLGGMAALPAIAWLVQGLPAMEAVGKVVWPYVLALLAGDAMMLTLYVYGMSTATRPARVSVRMLLRGSVRARFLIGVVVVGLLVPATVVLLKITGVLGGGSGTATLLVGAVAAVEAGGYFLRDAILRVGVYGPPV